MSRVPRQMMAPVVLLGSIVGLGVIAAGIFAGIGESSLGAVVDGLLVATVISILVRRFQPNSNRGGGR